MREEKSERNNQENKPNQVNDTTPLFIKVLTKKIIDIMSEEVAKPESQILIKRKIITPVINMIYSELYPYIIAMIVSIVTILVLSLLTFLGFIFYLIRK